MKRQILIFMTLVSLCTLVFVSCNQEDDLWENVDLSINSQIPMTRSDCEQSLGPDYNEFGYGDDECCLIALVEMKQQTMENHTFTQAYSARECYNNMLQLAHDIDSINGNDKPYNGGFMDLDLFLKVGQETSLFNERKHFGNGDEEKRTKYFNNKENSPQLIYIDEEDEKTKKKKPHVARVLKINHKDGTIVYSSKSAPFGQKTVSIDEVKDVWELNEDK